MGVAIISVEDEAAQASREFRCEIKLLMQHMQLLATDLSREEGAPTAGHDVQIRVKCDIATFAWLMAHVKAEGGSSSSPKKPQLDTSNALQLLLAAHYLQMPAVLGSCVAFIAANLLELVPSAAAQLCSLDTPLLEKLAQSVQEETLEALHAHCHQQQQQPLLQQHHQQQQEQSSRTTSTADPQQHTSGNSNSRPSSNTQQQRDTKNIPSSSTAPAAVAVVEKLYKHKLGCLLQQHGSTLLRCRACGQLFASCNHAKLQCPAACASAGRSSSRSRKLLLHEADTAWSLQAFLAQQRAKVKPDKQQQQRQVQAVEAQQQQQLTLGVHQQPLAPSQSPCQHHQQQQQLCEQGQGLLATSTHQHNQQQQHVAGAAGMSWRQLYWLTWGHVVVLYCQCCCSHFPARLLHECRYHPLPAVFPSDVKVGQYPCCGATAWQPPTYTHTHAGGAAAGGGAGGGARSSIGSSSTSSSNKNNPCCSRDHDPYVPAACGSGDDKGGLRTAGNSSGLQGSSGGGGGSDSPAALKRLQKQQQQQQRVSAARAVELLQLFAPLITLTSSPAAVAGCNGGRSCADVRPSSSQQRPHTQQQQHVLLPLLVKMVNRGAAAAACRSLRSPCVGGQAVSRPSSVSPLPALISPRGQQVVVETTAAVPAATATRSRKQQPQQQEFNLPAAVDAAAASAAAARGHRSGDTSSDSSSDSDGGSSSSGSRDGASMRSSSNSSTASSRRNSIEGSSKHTPAAKPRHGAGGVLQQSDPEREEAQGYASDNNSDDDDDEFSLWSGAAHSTPLSSMMGAVRAAAGARSKGLLGFSSGGSSSAGLMAAAVGGGGAGGLGRVGAPLAETFSAGGRRVLSRPAASRQQPVVSRPTTAAAAADSRPSNAASLLSLKQQQHQPQRQSDAPAGASRPGTTGGSSRLGTASSGVNRPHATTPTPAGSAAHTNGSDAGALSNIGAAFNRTLLVEMVQLDDAHRMGVLMRKLDSLRLQPPPDAVAVVSRTECVGGGGGGGQKKQRNRGQGGDGQQQQQPLTQFVDVMQAINSGLWMPPA